MHILNVVGARPNLMKIAPLVEQMERSGVVGELQANGSREVLAPPPVKE